MTTKCTSIKLMQFEAAMAAALKKTDFCLLTPNEFYVPHTEDDGVWPVNYAGHRVGIRTKDGNSILFYVGGTLINGEKHVYMDVNDKITEEEQQYILRRFVDIGKDYIRLLHEALVLHDRTTSSPLPIMSKNTAVEMESEPLPGDIQEKLNQAFITCSDKTDDKSVSQWKKISESSDDCGSLPPCL